MTRPLRFRSFSTLAVLFALSSSPGLSEAGLPFFRRRDRPVIETSAPLPRPQDQVAPSPMLGTFRATPYVYIRGTYSPLGTYGRENSLAVYGPLSSFRDTSAPITTVVRGYDGVPRVVEGTSFSSPNLPARSPVVYPTRASQYDALRFQGTSPRRSNALMWIDQN